MTVMTHVIALEAGQSSQGTSEPITPVIQVTAVCVGDAMTHHEVLYNSYFPDHHNVP